MLSKKLEEAINEQINKELYSGYLYLSMSAYCEAENLPGAANWIRIQAQEELGHAMRLFDHVNARGGRVVLDAIEMPPPVWKSPLGMFGEVLEHERKVTGLINRLYEVALSENDYATQIELQWFITEQVEEEESAGQVVEQLRRVGDQPMGLLMLDGQLGQRQAAPSGGEGAD
ncbi:MAG TPA: ferritin [Anaerolineae bacterium]|nr:ferritin [Anaerolineae bacterium]